MKIAPVRDARWDELADSDVDLEGEGWETDPDTAIHRKRPDAWAVHWGRRNLFILEFTRPNDRCATALQDTDAYKRDRYTPLYPRGGGLVYGSRRNGSSRTGLGDGPHVGGLGLGLKLVV